MSVEIRLATIDDVDELMRLGEQWLNPLWDKEIKRRWLIWILNSFNEQRIAVAKEECSGKLQGFVDFLYWHDWLTKKKRLLIQHVYVDENHRNKGVATRMLETILACYKPDFAFVDTKPDKFPHAQALYEKVGLQENPRRKWLERYKTVLAKCKRCKSEDINIFINDKDFISCRNCGRYAEVENSGEFI